MDKISSTTSESDNNQKNDLFSKDEFLEISKKEKEVEKDNNNNNDIINLINHISNNNLKTSYPLLFK